MLDVSPYADAESGAPSWRPGEREAAIVFLSLAIYIILDVNVSIYRVFRRKRGLYYWSLIFATWGTAIVVVGNILKNLKPEWGVIWPLETLLINGGWSIYAPAELLVLYSRLHLVNQNRRLHRHLFIMIVVGSTLIIIPNWVFIFPAYDIDPAISSEWSPRMAIIDRVSQAGFTLFEIIISSVYIHSLRDILHSQIDTRTSRVMRDLILVNVTVISMDLLVIILIFLDQANLAYPLQDLAYAFKYKIEFAVLNQLMAVAAAGPRHGSKQTTWEEKRYRRPGQATILKGYSDDDLTGVRLPFLSTSTDTQVSPHSTLVGNERYLVGTEAMDHAKIAKPPSIITKDQIGTDGNALNVSLRDGNVQPLDQNFAFHQGPDLALSLQSSNLSGINQIRGALEEKSSNDRLLAPIADDEKDLTLANVQTSLPHEQRQRKKNRISLRQVIFGKSNPDDIQTFSGSNSAPNPSLQDTNQHSRIAPFSSEDQKPKDEAQSRPQNNTRKSSSSRPLQRRLGSKNMEQKQRNQNTHEDSDEEDGLHVWERHGRGRSTLEVPWFRKYEDDNSNESTQKAHPPPV